MDAISLIVNRLAGHRSRHSRELVHAASRRPSLPSFGMPRRDRGRSGAAVQQDPIFRNLGETMGVYMSMDLRSKTPAEGLFRSSAGSRTPGD